jgi:hypothetical protein
MATTPWLKMAPLPRSEFYLAKALMEKYGMKGDEQYTVKGDWSELFTVALRVMYEVMHFDPPHGEGWIVEVIQNWRSNQDEVRTYEVDGVIVGQKGSSQKKG